MKNGQDFRLLILSEPDCWPLIHSIVLEVCAVSCWSVNLEWEPALATGLILAQNPESGFGRLEKKALLFKYFVLNYEYSPYVSLHIHSVTDLESDLKSEAIFFVLKLFNSPWKAIKALLLQRGCQQQNVLETTTEDLTRVAEMLIKTNPIWVSITLRNWVTFAGSCTLNKTVGTYNILKDCVCE